MICPQCGVHDAASARGVLLKIGGVMSGAEMMDYILTGTKPKQSPLDPPIAWCTECDYTADTREQFDLDCVGSEHYQKEQS